jgi:hypothetical protein
MIHDTKSNAAWRSYYMVISGATVVALVLLLPGLLQRYSDLGFAVIFRVLLVDVPGTILLAGAMVCLQYALYLGTSSTWITGTVISLFTAGFGGCLIVSVSYHLVTRNRQMYAPRDSRECKVGLWTPFFSLTLSMWGWIDLILITSWGLGFYSFSHFLRKCLISTFCIPC